MELIEYEYGLSRSEWLERRKEGIGGSAAGTLLGVNDYDTPWQYWARLKGLLPPKEETQATMMGHLLEPVVVELFERQTGFVHYAQTEGDFLVRNHDYPNLIGSPDRIGTLGGSPYVLECKTTAKDITLGDMPKSWFCQLQFYLMLTDIPVGAVAWLSRGREFGYEEIKRDDAFCTYMASRLTSWWQTHVIGGVPPEIGAEDVDRAYLESIDKSVELSAEGYTAVMRLQELKASIKEMEDEADKLTGYVKLAMGENEKATFKGQTVATWKQSKAREVFNAREFKEDHPELYAAYSSIRPGVRPFVLKK